MTGSVVLVVTTGGWPDERIRSTMFTSHHVRECVFVRLKESIATNQQTNRERRRKDERHHVWWPIVDDDVAIGLDQRRDRVQDENETEFLRNDVLWIDNRAQVEHHLKQHADQLRNIAYQHTQPAEEEHQPRHHRDLDQQQQRQPHIVDVRIYPDKSVDDEHCGEHEERIYQCLAQRGEHNDLARKVDLSNETHCVQNRAHARKDRLVKKPPRHQP